MRTYKIYTITFLVTFLLCNYLVNAQQAVCSLGGDASGARGSVAYSVGQVVCSTYFGVRGTEAQGFQQAYEFYNLSIKE
jgi:hypothetical protein